MKGKNYKRGKHPNTQKALQENAGNRKIYEEPKSHQVKVSVTSLGKEGFVAAAKRLGLSQAELIEQIGRGKIRLETVEDSAA